MHNQRACSSLQFIAFFYLDNCFEAQLFEVMQAFCHAALACTVWAACLVSSLQYSTKPSTASLLAS
jgi:hypothetical protein